MTNVTIFKTKYQFYYTKVDSYTLPAAESNGHVDVVGQLHTAVKALCKRSLYGLSREDK